MTNITRKILTGKLSRNLKSKERSPALKNLLIFIFVSAAAIFLPPDLFAHQSPTTIVLLDVAPDKVAMELQLPLDQLELAFGHDVNTDTENLIERLKPQLSGYLTAHIHPVSGENQAWAVTVTAMELGKAEQTQSGSYQEIKVHLNLTPPEGYATRQFVLNYDVIMHQVVTHSALVAIRRDWELGKTDAQPFGAGIIRVNTETMQIEPLKINLKDGDWREALSGMVNLGIRRVKEQIGFLCFLLLALSAALPSSVQKTANSGSANTFGQFIKIIKTAWLIFGGLCVSLMIASVIGFQISPLPTAALITVVVSIFAVQVVRPVFSENKISVIIGGLIFGLIFAPDLSVYGLSGMSLVLSLAGFCIGIGLMQFFVVGSIVPWLILLGRTDYYKPFKIMTAVLAFIAAGLRLIESLFDASNLIGGLTQNFSRCENLGVLMIALTALAAFGWQSRKNTFAFRRELKNEGLKI